VVTEPAELENVRQSIKGVIENISQGISEADVAWAKKTILNRAATEYSTPPEMISHAMDYVFYDITQAFDEKFLKEVSSLDVLDVQQAAILLSQGQWVEVIINGK
jgi:predicted Zn-dependent peptidase